MRILHVIPSVAAVRGGPSQAILGIVKALNGSGINAEIATTNDNGPALLDVPLGIRSHYAGVPVLFFPRFSPGPSIFREFAFSWSLASWLRANITCYDIVHVHAMFSYSSTLAMSLARRRGVPYIVRPLGLLCGWALRQSALRKSLYLKGIELRNLDGSAGLEFTAEQELAEAEPLKLKAPGFVLPFGLDLPGDIPEARRELRQLIGAPPDDRVILFLSRLHPKKGLDFLLDSLESLKKMSFSLVIAGSGSPEYEAALRTRAAAGPLKERVHFVGFAEGRFKQMLLQGADLFALTSHSESFGIAVLEAIAAGTPVLVTPGVPLAPLVERFQLGWVAQLDKESIASQVRLAFNCPYNEGENPTRRARARSLVASNFTWDHIARRMVGIYKEVLRDEAPSSFELRHVKLDN
jgi:glycosyltransferase involved in cell wall biosynthesis